MAYKTFFAMPALLVAMTVGSASAEIVSFDGGPNNFLHGNLVTSIMTIGFGNIGVSATLNGGGATKARIFNTTANGTAGMNYADGADNQSADTDLLNIMGDPLFGNALIIEEHVPPTPLIPDDNQIGGMITLTFAMPVVFGGVTFIDREPTQALTVLGDGAQIFSVNSGGPGGDSKSEAFDLTTSGWNGANAFAVSQLKFVTDGSGAIDNIVLSNVPLPGALPLFLSAIAFIGIFARRKLQAV